VEGLYVLLGNGDGTFETPVQFDTTHRFGGPSAAVGDFNRDGKPDVAVGNPYNPEVSVFLNRATQAAYSGIADGVWYFHVRAVDESAVGGPTATRVVRIDTQRPSAQAPASATVKHGDVARLTYVVNDPPPSAGWCNVKILIEDLRSNVKLVVRAHHILDGVTTYAAFRCHLPRGTYYFRVHATDPAGNQSLAATNRLYVN
jgi:hypothetical protein